MRYLHLYEQGLGCQAKAKREGREKYTRKPVRIDLSLRYAIVPVALQKAAGFPASRTQGYKAAGVMALYFEQNLETGQTVWQRFFK